MPACIARTVWYQSASHPHYHVVRHSRGRLMGRTDMVCWISGGLGGRSSTNCEMTSHTPSTRKSHYSLPAASVSLLHATPQHRLLPNIPAASHFALSSVCLLHLCNYRFYIDIMACILSTHCQISQETKLRGFNLRPKTLQGWCILNGQIFLIMPGNSKHRWTQKICTARPTSG